MHYCEKYANGFLLLSYTNASLVLMMMTILIMMAVGHSTRTVCDHVRKKKADIFMLFRGFDAVYQHRVVSQSFTCK